MEENFKKAWYVSRTLWLALAQGLAGIFLALATEYQSVGWIVVGKAVIDGVLRVLTVAPLGKGTDKPL